MKIDSFNELMFRKFLKNNRKKEVYILTSRKSKYQDIQNRDIQLEFVLLDEMAFKKLLNNKK